MMRLIGLSILVGVAGFSSGCATCCAPHDCDYLNTSGRYVRHNPTSGRVGSVFDEAGGPADVVQASAMEPTTAGGQPVQGQPMQGQPMQGQMQPGMSVPPNNSLPAPSRMAPQTRSVVPRNMGENYLPRGN
jgi:hypothetical protein